MINKHVVLCMSIILYCGLNSSSCLAYATINNRRDGLKHVNHSRNVDVIPRFRLQIRLIIWQNVVLKINRFTWLLNFIEVYKTTARNVKIWQYFCWLFDTYVFVISRMFIHLLIAYPISYMRDGLIIAYPISYRRDGKQPSSRYC